MLLPDDPATPFRVSTTEVTAADLARIQTTGWRPLPGVLRSVTISPESGVTWTFANSRRPHGDPAAKLLDPIPEAPR